ncbi:MAG: hypothetical protein NXI32_31390, partial [bacterium]|nr:hypothetical protein [bacterium]
MADENTSTPISLTFGDVETGQFKTKLIPLSSGSADVRQAKIQQALEELANITNVTVTGEGTEQAPYLIKISSNYGVAPSLSSDRWAVSKLTAAVGDAGQKLSFFTDVGTFGGGPGIAEISVVTPMGVVNTDIDLARARANSNYIETQIENLANVNTQVLVTGSGTHQDPWEIEFANGVGTIVAVNVDSIMKNTRGVVQLQNVPDPNLDAYYALNPPTAGAAGTPDAWTLYNTANAGRFKLSYAGGMTGSLPWNATAIEIQQALAGLMSTQAPHASVVDTVTVSGTGRPESPWQIRITDVAKAFPDPTIENDPPADPSWLANLSFGQGLNLDFVGTGGIDDFIGPAASVPNPAPLTFIA